MCDFKEIQLTDHGGGVLTHQSRLCTYIVYLEERLVVTFMGRDSADFKLPFDATIEVAQKYVQAHHDALVAQFLNYVPHLKEGKFWIATYTSHPVSKDQQYSPNSFVGVFEDGMETWLGNFEVLWTDDTFIHGICTTVAKDGEGSNADPQ